MTAAETRPALPEVLACLTAEGDSRADVAAWYGRGMVLDATPPAAGSAPQAAPKTPRTRDEDRAWYALAFALRAVAPDAPGPAGIDYEAAARRVQCSPSSPEDAMIAQAMRGAGHVRADPVEARLRTLTGRPLLVLRWLRAFGPALEWLAADLVDEKRGALLDALATGGGVATAEEARRWHVSGRQADARRQWARLRLREAWAAWYGRAW